MPGIGLDDAAVRLFGDQSNRGQWEVVRMVLRIFRQGNVRFLVAQVCFSLSSLFHYLLVKAIAEAWHVRVPRFHFW